MKYCLDENDLRCKLKNAHHIGEIIRLGYCDYSVEDVSVRPTEKVIVAKGL